MEQEASSSEGEGSRKRQRDGDEDEGEVEGKGEGEGEGEGHEDEGEKTSSDEDDEALPNTERGVLTALAGGPFAIADSKRADAVAAAAMKVVNAELVTRDLAQIQHWPGHALPSDLRISRVRSQHSVKPCLPSHYLPNYYCFTHTDTL